MKNLLFWTGLVAIPFLFFTLVEAGLRLGNAGVDTRLFNEVDWEGRRYYRVNPDVVHRYFSDPEFGTYVARDRFLAQKPANGFRIFCLGASTTIGFPYMYNGAYSGLMKDRLERYFPDRQVEVVNLGITAINSFSVAELAREVMAYEPDLLVVYMGHNEFYGALGIGSTEYAGSTRAMVQLYLGLQRMKTVQLLRRGMTWLSGTISPTPGYDDRQLMEKMVRKRHIAYQSREYAIARSYFRANYEAVVRSARDRGVDVLISTLASNLRDQTPFVSSHSAGLTEEEKASWADLAEKGNSAAEQARWTAAIEWYERALEIDDQRADLHFQRARSLDALGDRQSALEAYQRARDLDVLRFRASSDFNDVIRAIAHTHSVPLVDMEAELGRHASGAVPGEDLFWEHVHPTFDGYFLMARAIVESIRRHGIIAGEDEWEPSGDLPDEFYRWWAGITEFDHEVARLRIDLLKSRWPFRDEPVSIDFKPDGRVQEAAWDYLRGAKRWAATHDELAKSYQEDGDLERAAGHYWAIGKMSTYDPHYSVLAADLVAKQGHLENASLLYAHALRIAETPETHAKLGVVRYNLHDFSGAVEHLEAALAGPAPPRSRTPNPVLARIHLLLSTAYLNVGDPHAAERHLDRLDEIAPDAPQLGDLRRALERSREGRPFK